jgi:hypothetical protein
VHAGQRFVQAAASVREQVINKLNKPQESAQVLDYVARSTLLDRFAMVKSPTAGAGSGHLRAPPLDRISSLASDLGRDMHRESIDSPPPVGDDRTYVVDKLRELLRSLEAPQ